MSVKAELMALFESRVDGVRWQERIESHDEASRIAADNRARVVSVFNREASK